MTEPKLAPGLLSYVFGGNLVGPDRNKGFLFASATGGLANLRAEAPGDGFFVVTATFLVNPVGGCSVGNQLSVDQAQAPRRGLPGYAEFSTPAGGPQLVHTGALHAVFPVARGSHVVYLRAAVAENCLRTSWDALDFTAVFVPRGKVGTVGYEGATL